MEWRKNYNRKTIVFIQQVLLVSFLIFVGCKTEGEKTKKATEPISIKKQEKKNTNTEVIQKQFQENPKSLPKEIKYEAVLQDSLLWTDKQGKHIVVISEVEDDGYQNPKFHGEDSDGGFDKELFGYHYVKKSTDKKYKLQHKVYDFIADCPVDSHAGFIKNTLHKTDLNANGVSEIWYIYTLFCKGDVSPSDMKIIMYEGKNKYAIRGETKITFYNDNGSVAQTMGGNYKIDKSFNSADPILKEYALILWKQNEEGTNKNDYESINKQLLSWFNNKLKEENSYYSPYLPFITDFLKTQPIKRGVSLSKKYFFHINWNSKYVKKDTCKDEISLILGNENEFSLLLNQCTVVDDPETNHTSEQSIFFEFYIDENDNIKFKQIGAAG